MEIPKELSKIFTDIHFKEYPKVLVPQNFTDERGTIKNIVEVKRNGNTSRRCLEGESKTVDFLITCIPQNSSLPSPYEG